jgi:hypothetical protein
MRQYRIPPGNIWIAVIICAAIVAGIAVYFLMPVSLFSGVEPQGSTSGRVAQMIPPLMTDASFDVMEVNTSIVTYINSTSATTEQLKIYPELEKCMHGTSSEPSEWRQGWREVAVFAGNMSQWDAVVKEICKGKTVFECNHGTLIEYHNHYYRIAEFPFDTMPRTPTSRNPE